MISDTKVSIITNMISFSFKGMMAIIKKIIFFIPDGFIPAFPYNGIYCNKIRTEIKGSSHQNINRIGKYFIRI